MIPTTLACTVDEVIDMDPNATYKLLQEALLGMNRHPEDAGYRQEAIDALEALTTWLARGGFPPRLTYDALGRIRTP